LTRERRIQESDGLKHRVLEDSTASIPESKHARQGRMVLQQLVREIEVHSEPVPESLATPRPAGLLAGMVLGVASPEARSSHPPMPS
jgi:hypothetical protein